MTWEKRRDFYRKKVDAMMIAAFESFRKTADEAMESTLPDDIIAFAAIQAVAKDMLEESSGWISTLCEVETIKRDL